MWLLGLLVAAAPEPVGIVLLEAGEVTTEETAAVLNEVAAAVRKVGRDPIEVRSVDSAPAIFFELRILGAVRYLRIEIERRGPGPGETRAVIDLRKDPDLWPVELERLMLDLLGPAPAPGIVVSTPPEPQPRPSVTPWVLAGVGVVALAVGIGFGASSASARSQSERSDLSDSDFDRYADRTQAHAIVADVGFVVAAVSAIGAGAWWALE